MVSPCRHSIVYNSTESSNLKQVKYWKLSSPKEVVATFSAKNALNRRSHLQLWTWNKEVRYMYMKVLHVYLPNTNKFKSSDPEFLHLSRKPLICLLALGVHKQLTVYSMVELHILTIYCNRKLRWLTLICRTTNYILNNLRVLIH